MMIPSKEIAVSFALLSTLLLAACAAPQAPVQRGLSPEQEQRLVDRQQELAEELAQVRGELDQVQASLGEQQAAIDELERRRPAQAGEDESTTAPEAVLDLSPTEVYRKSFAAYAAGDYARAIEGFELFVENFPESTYAGNAYYWLGESRFARKEYEEAISAFRSLAEKFPQNTKVPEGLFKVAQSYARMDKPEKADKIIELLRERYPKSGAAQRTLETASP